jgi:HPt (histidine-containing phosphotransfer) domain-containing protein
LHLRKGRRHFAELRRSPATRSCGGLDAYGIIEARMAESPQFAELRTRYVQSLPDKRAALGNAWRAFASAPDERAAIELQALAHRLAGSAPAYGFEAIGEAAHVVDALVNAWMKHPASDREDAGTLAARIAAPMQALIASLAQAIEAATKAG